MATADAELDEGVRAPWAALRTETGAAGVLVAFAVAALVWVNLDSGSYDRFWHSVLTLQVSDSRLSMTLVDWVDDGLMAFFFFVVGLEARQELDLGELRERRRVVLPLLAGTGGMAGAVGVYLLVTAGTPATSGWGVAMSTDTAFALGVLAIVGPRLSSRLRTFLLTVVVVDDVVALVVIAAVYTEHVSWRPLVVAVGLLLVVLALRRAGVRHGQVYLVLAVGLWFALVRSGVDPVVSGLVMGLLTYAAPASRTDLDRATMIFRSFREQPSADQARSVRLGIRTALSPNTRLQALYAPWTSFVVLPLFALANAGVRLDGHFLASAGTSRVTWAVAAGYVLGKPVGIAGVAWLVTALSRGRLQAPVGWAAVVGGGATAGVGFTVSLLIADLAFRGEQLDQAKLGILTSLVGAAAVGRLVFAATGRLAPERRARALLGRTAGIVDLAEPVDPDRDHVRGPHDARVTLVEYGDLECPHCGQAEPGGRELLRDNGDLRYVWRHLPLTGVHPHAQLAAEATEAAHAQGKFWEMHDLLFDHQDALRLRDLVGHAERLGLDREQFLEDLRQHTFAARVADDVDGADLSGVSGTPTFFVNGERHHGPYDLPALRDAVRVAKARAHLTGSTPAG